MDGEESIPPTSIETLETSGQEEPSPFSSKKVVHKSDTPHSKSNQAAEGTNSSSLHTLQESDFIFIQAGGFSVKKMTVVR
jgi:hypothetical protein